MASLSQCPLVFPSCQLVSPSSHQRTITVTISEVLTRRVSALLDDLSLFASRIVFLRDVSPPFSGKILMVHIVAKREGKKNGLVSVQITSAVKNELV